MTELAQNPYLTPEEYLEGEPYAKEKHEYVDGVAYAMAGAGENHNRIAMNIGFHFRTATRGKRCGAYMADMKLRLVEQNIFYYPDVMLTCQPEDDHPLYKTQPCVLVEVLSPSTAPTDRREKWHAYRNLPSLKAYLMVDSEIRRAEYYQRDDTGIWHGHTPQENQVFSVGCGEINIALSLDDLYEDVRVPVV